MVTAPVHEIGYEITNGYARPMHEVATAAPAYVGDIPYIKPYIKDRTRATPHLGNISRAITRARMRLDTFLPDIPGADSRGMADGIIALAGSLYEDVGPYIINCRTGNPTDSSVEIAFKGARQHIARMRATSHKPLIVINKIDSLIGLPAEGDQEAELTSANFRAVKAIRDWIMPDELRTSSVGPTPANQPPIKPSDAPSICVTMALPEQAAQRDQSGLLAMLIEANQAIR